MHIENGTLKGVRWQKARSFGGDLTAPRFIVLHDTAGRCDPFSSVNWFASPECKTSAHFVIERDGTITQMVPTTKRAYHAGQSQWNGVHSLNSCSIGIEIVNPGKLDAKGNAWFGKAADPKEIVARQTEAHSDGYWLPYTDAQIKSATEVCRALVDAYPDCNEIVTHWQISPGRKIDPCPLFPLEELKVAVFEAPGETEPALAAATPALAPANPKIVKSGTLWGVNFASIGTALNAWAESVASFGMEWVATVATLKPMQGLLEPILGNTKALGASVTAYGLTLIVTRRLKASAEGKKG